MQQHFLHVCYSACSKPHSSKILRRLYTVTSPVDPLYPRISIRTIVHCTVLRGAWETVALYLHIHFFVDLHRRQRPCSVFRSTAGVPVFGRLPWVSGDGDGCRVDRRHVAITDSWWYDRTFFHNMSFSRTDPRTHCRGVCARGPW